MSKQTCAWPYADLRTGDWVCCGGDGLLAGMIRFVTAGRWKGVKNRNVSTHTGILIRLGQQLLVAEMTAPRIVISSLEVQYRERGRRIICFRRPIVKDVEAYRTAVQDGVGEMYRRGVEYDFKGLLEFVSKRVKDSGKRMYCSEMVYILSKDHVVEPFAEKLSVKVSPEDLHTCPQADTVWTAP